MSRPTHPYNQDVDGAVVTDWRMVYAGIALGVGCLVALCGVLTGMALTRQPPEAPPVALADTAPKRPVLPTAPVPVLITEKSPSPVEPRPPEPEPRETQAVPAERIVPARTAVGARPKPPVEEEDDGPPPRLRHKFSDAPSSPVIDSCSEVEHADALLDVPELRYDLVRKLSNAEREKLFVAHQEERGQLYGLPFRLGEACRTGETATKNLAQFSRAIRRERRGLDDSDRTYREKLPRDWKRYSPIVMSYSKRASESMELMRTVSGTYAWQRAEAVPALHQIFSAESEPGRMGLTELLGQIQSAEATSALAARVLFDLSPEVRSEAIGRLRERSRREYREILLEGLHHPWLPVAQHAAEALAQLKDRSAVPTLVGLLDATDPNEPVKREDGTWEVKEPVRINHLRNCLMCHASSTDAKDPVRGLIPTPGQPLPRVYYESRKGEFARADVVYLRQDFSLMQPVSGDKHWPRMQRFDFIVRTKLLTEAEAKTWSEKHREDACRRREAIQVALTALTGLDPFPTAQEWRSALQEEGAWPAD